MKDIRYNSLTAGRLPESHAVEKPIKKRLDSNQPLVHAGMAELADAPDLGSGGKPCRFKSCYPYHDGVTKKMSHHFFSIHAGLRDF